MCAQNVQKYDDTVVRNWKDEIDTLLVFVRAGDAWTLAIGLTVE